MKLRVNVSQLLYVCLSIFVISIPLLSTLFMVEIYLHKHLLNFVPTSSDEIYYWHQAATFRLANFNGGYYTVNELPAPASFIHFYSWGPVYPILFGTLGKIILWRLYYAPILNIILFSLAVTWFILATKPNYQQLVMLGLALLTFWPVQLYMATNMVVVFSCTMAVILASFFYHWVVKEPKETSNLNLIIFFLIICLMSLFKVSWSLLFIPYLLLVRQKIRLSILPAIIVSIVLVAISYFVYYWLSAPYPEWINIIFLNSLKTSISGGLHQLSQHMRDNLRIFFDLKQPKLYLLLRAQMIISLVFSGILLWKKYRDNSITRESLVIITNSLFLLLSTFVLYDIGDVRDFRLFAPILLMIILLFVARKRLAIVLFFILLNIVLIRSFLNTFTPLLAKSFPDNTIEINEFKAQISPVIKYDANKSAWDNTLLIPRILVFDNRLLGVHAGIGLSWFESPDALEDVKSRYLIISQSDYEVLKNHACLQFMFTTDIGNLYINQGSSCNK